MNEEVQIKRCSNCQSDLPISDFHRRSATARNSRCKLCQSEGWKKWYRANPDRAAKHRARNKLLDRARTAELREFVSEFKKRPCEQCGGSFHPWQMQFDHVRGEKVDDVCMMVGRGFSKEKLSEEIQKCEVVCANCHADRTYRRRKLTGW